MDLKLITARRKEIQKAAPCTGCGATLAFCKSHRGKDPTAPPWFGCCAQGVFLTPCQHVPSVAALIDPLKEIESGELRSEEQMLLDSLEEFPSGRIRGSLRTRALSAVMDSWPDDVPMTGEI